MTQSFDAALQAFVPALPLAVALSGGADSTALLLGCARRWPGQVRAIHVHHGLQAAADGFERHCTALCHALDVPLVVRRLDARHAPGQSPEDAARQARYQAFEAFARDHTGYFAIKSIALAQHADDQAETLLLALSRGEGPRALASLHAMRNSGHRLGGTAVRREWLDHTLLSAACEVGAADIGRALLNERRMSRPQTPLTRHWAARLGLAL